MNNEQLIELTKEFIHNATSYNMTYLEKIYSDSLIIVMVDENDKVTTMDKLELMSFFQNRFETGVPALSEKSDFLYSICNEQQGMVIVNREMKFNERPEKMLFTLIWEKNGNDWQVVKESSSVRPL